MRYCHVNRQNSRFFRTRSIKLVLFTCPIDKIHTFSAVDRWNTYFSMTDQRNLLNWLMKSVIFFPWQIYEFRNFSSDKLTKIPIFPQHINVIFNFSGASSVKFVIFFTWSTKFGIFLCSINEIHGFLGVQSTKLVIFSCPRYFSIFPHPINDWHLD